MQQMYFTKVSVLKKTQFWTLDPRSNERCLKLIPVQKTEEKKRPLTYFRKNAVNNLSKKRSVTWFFIMLYIKKIFIFFPKFFFFKNNV